MAKTIYAVQDSDGSIIYSTTDREYAREVKADEGGKKAGVVIIAYKRTKEIR